MQVLYLCRSGPRVPIHLLHNAAAKEEAAQGSQGQEQAQQSALIQAEPEELRAEGGLGKIFFFRTYPDPLKAQLSL